MVTIGIFCVEYHSPYKPYFRRQAEAFANSEVRVFTWEGSYEDLNGVKVMPVGHPWVNSRFFSLWRKICGRIGIPLRGSSKAEVLEIETLLKANDIDFVIAQTGFAGDRVAEAAVRAGVPFAVYFRGADLREGMKVRGWGRRISRICSNATIVFVVGKYMVSELVSLGVDRSKIIVEPTGAPVHDRVLAGPFGRDNCFLFVGRLVPCKAVEVIIDAIAEARSRGVKIELDIAGDGPMKEELQDRVLAHRIDDRVRFLGFCNPAEIQEWMDQSSALVIHTVDHPGGPEAFGVSVTEAMASARPVITSRCGGLIDQIIDGEQGFVVEQRDVAGLADAMIRIGGDSDLRKQMGESARARAGRLFDATDRALTVEKISIEVVSKAAGPRSSGSQ